MEMNSDTNQIKSLILGMKEAFFRGENAMAWARKNVTSQENILTSTLIAYDLQAGSYRDIATKNPKYFREWSSQLANLIRPYIKPSDSILEVGIGEATTLSGVIKELDLPELKALGFDVSWSRIHVAQSWIADNSVQAKLFVADLFSIPLADNSIDVIYTSHSLEPNGGREEAAIKELFRVARKAVVLVEPIFELANDEAQKRMSQHGYVKGLKATAEKLNLNVVDYGLLDLCANPLNPSGVVLLLKNQEPILNGFDYYSAWQCPTTYSPMVDQGDLFYANLAGIAYPVMRGIPMLRAEHGIVASKI
jgi:ubiquinone/menaquinone biosynthesis C-methylase UbiE